MRDQDHIQATKDTLIELVNLLPQRSPEHRAFVKQGFRLDDWEILIGNTEIKQNGIEPNILNRTILIRTSSDSQTDQRYWLRNPEIHNQIIMLLDPFRKIK